MTLASPAQVALLDSSPLLLWLAGRADPLIIARFKHLSMFQIDDFELLDRLLKDYKSISTTPHVLTEVSNHAHHLKGSLGESLLQEFALFSQNAPERFRESKVLSRRGEFVELGITDCALCDLGDEVTVITTDFRLTGQLQSSGKMVINLNHLRESRLLP